MQYSEQNNYNMQKHNWGINRRYVLSQIQIRLFKIKKSKIKTYMYQTMNENNMQNVSFIQNY